MPLFELEEGTSRKFYRIDRDGTTIVLQWGRIGTAGQRKVLTFATEAYAEQEYGELMRERRERGYRQVIDESQPHDADEAQRRVLEAATGPLTEHPRFLFRHPKHQRITWLELRGTTLAVASSEPGKDTATEPDIRAFAKEEAATRERDRLMAKLHATGFELVMIGSAPSGRREPLGALQSHPELEAAIAEHPRDEPTWDVYEDWLMQVRDPRAEIVEHERAGDANDAVLAFGRIVHLLLGQKAGTLLKRLDDASWRAGFLRTCRFDVGSNDRILQELLATPAAKFLHELDLRVANYQLLGPLVRAPLLEKLRLFVEAQGHYAFNANLLHPLERLTELHVELVSSLVYHPCLARLRRLRLAPSEMLDYGPTFAHPFTALRELELDTRSLDEGVAARMLARLIASPLPAQLSRLVIVGNSRAVVLDPEDRATVHGGAFGKLEHVELPWHLAR